jgi:hypothetical protein
MTRLLVGLLVGLFAVPVLAAPVPKWLKKKPPLRAKIEPRPGEKLYTADFDDVPFSKVAEWYEMHSGLMFIAKDKPDGLKVTLHAEQVCMSELFAQLDDILYPHGFVVAQKAVSFSTIPVKDLLRYAQHIPLIDREELDRRSLYSLVQVVVGGDDRVAAADALAKEIKGGGPAALDDSTLVEAGTALAKEIKEVGFEVSTLGTDKLIVRGLAKDVRKLVNGLGDRVKK